MKKSLLPLLILCFLLPIYAQAQTKITGTVFDNKTKETIISAGIRVMNAKDSSYVAGAATDENGKFSINVNQGKYVVHVSFIGYISQYFSVNTQNSTSIGNIYLKEDAILLSEATVTAKAIEIQVKGDTIEYNADSYKVQESAVVEDLLKKMPGAEVDSDGKITINGKEVKKILVDGKEFFSNDPKVASKNLPAAMVEKLQVLDKKSDMAQMTGFDDGEEETVINLTIKKGMKEGLYGSATGGIGNKDRYGVSGIANYMRNESQFTLMAGSNNTNNEGFTDNVGNTFRGMRGGRMMFGGRNGITQSSSGGLNFALNPSTKLKWGGNVRYGETDNDVEQRAFTQKYKTDSIKGDSYENKKNWGLNESNNFNSEFRFEWSPDSLTQIIFSPTFQYGKNRNTQNSEYLSTFENLNDTINSGNSSYFSEGTSKNISSKLEFSRQLGKKGRVLSFSLSGGINDLENDGFNKSKTIFHSNDSISNIDQIYNQKNNGYNWRGYISYVEPLANNNFIQLNYSYRKNFSESDKKTFSFDQFGNYNVIDTASTKKLENNFTNQEIGLNFKSIREKYNYTIGIALQPSSSESHTITPLKTSVVSNNVLNIAPVAQFNYLWDKRHNLRIDYNGSTDQPSVTQLSDVRDESDPLNVTYGNPDLKPAFTNRLRLRYQKFKPEQGSVFMMMGGFNFVIDDIVNKTINKKNGVSESTYDNANGNWNANLRMVMNRPLRNKKFSLSSMTFGSYQQNSGFINDDKNTIKTYAFMESLGLQFRSDIFDTGIRANFRYSDTKNTLSDRNNRTIYNYGGIFNATLRLPLNFTIDTDLSYTANSGASQGFEQNQWIWDVGFSKQVFKQKNGTIKLNIYDMLQQQTNISQSSSEKAFSETITNTLKSYFMVSFSYRFQIFKGGAKRPDSEMDNMFRGPGGGGRARM